MGNKNKSPNPGTQSQPDLKQQDPKYTTKNQNVMPYQTPYYQFPQPQWENSVHLQIKAQQPSALQSLVANQRQSLVKSSPNLPYQSMLLNQTNSSNLQQSVMLKNPEYPIGSAKNIINQPQQLPMEMPGALIIVKPSVQTSILRKGATKKSDKKVKIETMTVEMDGLRYSLRQILKQITQKMIPEFDSDIVKISNAIQAERQQKLKNKNKVLFLLKQKAHYCKLSQKLKDYSQRIKAALLSFRKKDALTSVTKQQYQAAKHLSDTIGPFVKNVEKDLPQKGWQVLIEQPYSGYYKNVVQKAQQDPQMISKYNQLEQSLTNPLVLQQIAQQNMMYSNSRRVGESTQEQAKKFIEGPAFYNKQQLKDSKNLKTVG